jgi:hypothetical protein
MVDRAGDEVHDKIHPMRFQRLFTYVISLFVFTALACQSPIPSLASAPAQPAALSGSVLYQDDFSSSTTGWDRLASAEGVMDYDGGGYRILVNALQVSFWSTPHKNLSDVRMEVDMGKLAGPDENRIGLICRYTGTDYYFFTSDGYYAIGKFIGGQITQLGQSEMQYNENIRKGVTVNHLRGDCIGDTLTLYVNGFQIAQVQDATLTSGDVGLMAGTFAQPGVDIIFDNFVVLQP